MNTITDNARGGVRTSAGYNRYTLVTFVFIGQMQTARINVASVNTITFFFFALNDLFKTCGYLHVELMSFATQCQ